MSKREANVHASCVAIGAHGVLLVGKSGVGKSDLALRLIAEGARLVADDRTILFVAKGALHGRAPESVKGLLEIRGLGIIAIPVRSKVKIALVVRLGREGARLPASHLYHMPATLKGAKPVPQITLNARFASTPAKIRAALAAFSRSLFRDTFITN
ncbi:MAG TPA: HPr kinase/phosphatase C-terminal domain-containing protein [Rhizomicrobium sp.]|jgi:HPr kinase/phosphorylase|nr:HPr kinase/phosphatase C-terminal domain-containing protein [Rhizomicrobium sp.]